MSEAEKASDLSYEDFYRAWEDGRIGGIYSKATGFLIHVSAINQLSITRELERTKALVEVAQKERDSRIRAQATGVSLPPSRSDHAAFGGWLSDCRERGLTYQAIADIVGVGRERIRQLWSKHQAHEWRVAQRAARVERRRSLDEAEKSLSLAFEYIACGIDRREAYRRNLIHDRIRWGHLR